MERRSIRWWNTAYRSCTETILSIERESFRFLLEDARRNQEAVRRDLEDPGAAAGQAAEAADFRVR